MKRRRSHTLLVALALPLATLTVSGVATGTAEAACTQSVGRDTVSPGCGTPSPTPTPTASPSPSPTPSSTGVPGVSIGSDGWITYSDDETDRLGVTGTVTTINGTVQSDGTCQLDYNFTGSSGSPTYQQEVGYNPSTCQQRVLTGTITPTQEASLASPTDTNDVPETPQASSSTGDATTAVSPVAQPYGNTGEQSAANPDSTSYSNAHTKTAWIDPVDITITSLTTNLRWPLYGAGGSLNARNNAYKFKYDGWSTSGTPTPSIGSVSGGWGTGGSETFKNSDFEEYVIGLFGPSGYAACGFSTATAVFKHNVHVYGYRNGSYKSTWSDTKSGGCSNLVHHRVSHGFGWTS